MGGSLEYSELEEVWAKYPGLKTLCRTFVETGTYHGVTSRAMAPHFDQVITTEIVPLLWSESKAQGEKEGIDNIDYHLGDSVKILEALKVKVPAVFFMDAHISGSDSGYNGDKLVPVLDELQIVLTHNSSPSLYIIDDCRFFLDHDGAKLGAWDWKDVTTASVLGVFEKLGRKVANSWVKNDRFFVVVE